MDYTRPTETMFSRNVIVGQGPTREESSMERPEIFRSSRIPKSFLAAVVGALVLFAACGRDKQSAQPLPPNQGRRISVPFDALRAQFRNPT
jgi:hypothetical protein